MLGLVAEGLTNRAVADRLVVAERTIEAHISSIFGKLDLPDSPDHHRRVLAVLTRPQAWRGKDEIGSLGATGED